MSDQPPSNVDTIPAARTADDVRVELDEASPQAQAAPALPTCGCMTIVLVDNGTSRPVPQVSFSPPGRFTPGLMMDFLPFFAQEIERAQAKVRREAEAARIAALSASPNATPNRRRR